MTVNLSQHRAEILKAYNEVIDNKNDINWALFGYEGNSNVLKFVDKGDGGLDELIGSLNAAQVQYGVCIVEDNITKVSKFLLINWQGEGVPTGRLGVCAPHLPEVRNLFKGVSLTYNARNEDDVEPDAVKAFVCKTSSTFASAIRGGGHSMISDLDTHDPPKPVGSVYSRVNPGKDINTKDRDKFWEQTELEESKRVAAEQERRVEEAKRVQLENQRQQEVQVRAEMESDIDRERRTKSDHMRQERLQEVQQMVGQRSNVRAMWERPDHNDNITSPPAKSKNTGVRKWPPTETEKTSDRRLSNGNQQNIEPPPAPISPPPPISSVNDHPVPLIPAAAEFSRHSATNGRSILAETILKRPDSDSEPEDPPQEWDDSDVPPKTSPAVVPHAEPMQSPAYEEMPATQQQPAKADLGMCARALWDYQAADDTEISFEPDDIIVGIQQIDPGWWRGENSAGAQGLFPANYVELL